MFECVSRVRVGVCLWDCVRVDMSVCRGCGAHVSRCMVGWCTCGIVRLWLGWGCKL